MKKAIVNNRIQVVNLTLTKNNKLVSNDKKVVSNDKKVVCQKDINIESNIDKIVACARLAGLSKDIATFCGHKCTLISKSKTEHILYIPEDVIQLNDWIDCVHYRTDDDIILTKHLQDLRGNIKVIGGKGLKNVAFMFSECKFISIDFSAFHTDNVTNMYHMFSDSVIDYLNLSHFNTSKTVIMRGMFAGLKVKRLNINNFNTKNVAKMDSMFSEMELIEDDHIDLSFFDFTNLDTANFMFSQTRVKDYIKISNAKMDVSFSLNEMFYNCMTDTIIFTNNSISGTTIDMFKYCEANKIILNGTCLDTDEEIFTNCRTKNIEANRDILKRYSLDKGVVYTG